MELEVAQRLSQLVECCTKFEPAIAADGRQRETTQIWGFGRISGSVVKICRGGEVRIKSVELRINRFPVQETGVFWPQSRLDPGSPPPPPPLLFPERTVIRSRGWWRDLWM